MKNGLSFVNELRDEIYEQKEELHSFYKNHRTEYTSKMKEIVTGLIAKRNMGVYSEYYKIDYTGWITEENKKLNGIPIFKWEFNYAIEHENDKDWTYELLKLAFIRAKVRIVIGYIDNKLREKGNYEKELHIIEAQMKNFPPDAIGSLEEYYVVLMNKTYNEVSPDDPFDFKIYKVSEKKVEPIN